jgi:peptide/nickel transport system permease protein
MIFSLWLKILPGATVFASSTAILDNPKMLILPVLTASLVEMGYILRITRASVVEVVQSNYVRTAILKGLTRTQVVLRHVLRNSLLAPITVIMLHVNWLIGGLVVVESVFGYPGLGNFILNAALYKDVYAIEAASMFLILLAVGTQLIADIIYSFLNPRVRYA